MAIIGKLILALLVGLPCLVCFTFTKEPQSPITVVLGHNTTNVYMEWKYDAQGSTVANFQLKRFLHSKDNSLSKETVLVYFAPGFDDWNRTLYVCSASLGASGYANFTIKDVLKRLDNTDKSKVSYLSGEVYTYRLDVSTIRPSLAVTSSTVDLQVYFPSSCAIHPNAATVNETDNVLLNVTITGNPPVQGYTWTFPNGSTVSRDNNILTFPASRQDAGTYKVIVDNGVGGPSECTSDVTVQFKPRLVNISIIKGPVREENGIILANETNSFNLTCEADAKPAAAYKWTVPDPSLFTELNLQILVFNNVSRDYVGEYICTASNIVGDTNSSKNLTVYFPSSCAIHPNATTVNETDNVLLTVTTTGNPPVQGYTWTFPNGSTVSRDNNILTFPASRRDAGTYKVTVHNGVGEPSECTSNVTVQFPPVALSQSLVTVAIYQNKTIQCSAEGEPEPTFSWTSTTNKALVTRDNGKTLVLINTTLDDSGNYTCTAMNILGSSISTTRVTVIAPVGCIIYPRVLPAITVNESEPVTLTCNATGYPPVNHFSWTYPNDTRHPGSSVLQYRASRMDITTYYCSVRNSIGDSANCTRNVRVQFKPGTPIISLVKDFQSKTKEENGVILANETDSFNLTCESDAKPAATYKWTVPDPSLFTELNQQILVFNNVSRDYAGEYICTVSNIVGDTNSSKNLTIYYPPSNITILPPRTQINIKERDRLYMRCQGDSYPPPTYTWKHNGMTLVGKQNGILEFKSINRRQNGTYRCEAKNHLGSLLSEPVDITVQYLDDLNVIGSSNKSYSQSNPLVLFNLSVNAYPVRNTTLTCNPSVPNVMTVITNYNAGLQYKHYLVVVIIQNVVETANITCIAENSMDKQEKTLFFYRQPILFKEQFEAQFKMTNQEWQDELKDPKTTEYKNLAKKCIKIIENAYSGLPYLAGVNIKTFLKGSILVRFELEVIGQVSDPLLPLRDYIKRQGGEIDGLQIDYNSIQTSSEVKDDSPIPVPEANKTLVAVLGALLALSIILNILLIAGFLWLRRKDSRGFKKRSNKSDEIGQMNEISMQETSLNDIPNVPEYEPIGRRGLASNTGIPEYEAVSTRTQPTQPQSAVETNNPMPQYESADRHRLPGADSNTPSVTYQTIQPHTDDYGSLSPSTRLPPRDKSTGSPTRAGEYQALQQKGVASQYQSLDDLSRC